MARKRRGSSGVQRGGDTAVVDAHSAVITTTERASVTDVLDEALAALDAVAEESHRRQQRDTASGRPPLTESRKRTRDGEEAVEEEQSGGGSSSAAVASSGGGPTPAAVYAAMAKPHYETITTAVVAFGLQLLPVLHAVVRRVSLAVSTPALASPDAWETAAVLCAYYGAGPAARMVEELLEVLVRARGVLLLDAACVVGEVNATAGAENALLPKLPLADLTRESSSAKEVAATGWANGTRGAPASAALLDTVNRKLAALTDMLTAVGPYLPASLVQRVAVRFTQEVVESGMLSLEAAVSRVGGGGSTLKGTAALPSLPGSGANPSARLYWRVPAACQASCLELLRSLLMLRAAPAELAVCAGRVVAEVTASLHRGALVRPTPVTLDAYGSWPTFVVYRDVVAAAARLRQTVAFLRHPATLPLYRPLAVTEEYVAGKVLVVAPTAAPDTAPVPAAGTVPTGSAPPPAMVSAVSTQALHPAMAPPAPRSGPGIPTPPPPAPERSTVAAVRSAAAPTPTPAYVKERLTAAAPVRPQAPIEEDNESIPDIDMDDE